jgi:ADP-ribosylglycohydrolase
MEIFGVYSLIQIQVIMPISSVAPALTLSWPAFFSSDQCKKYSGYALTVLGGLGAVGSGVLFCATTAVLPAVAVLAASIGLMILGKYVVDAVPTLPTPTLQLSEKIQAATSAAALYRAQHVSSVALQERIEGSVFGQAIGDGLGLLTEFTTTDQARNMIAGRPLEYALKNDPLFTNGPANSFRARFLTGTFTDDTEQACCLVRAEDQKRRGSTRSLEQLFADQMFHWSRHGLDSYNGYYTSTEAPSCRDIGTLTGQVVNCPFFRMDPQAAAFEVWRNQAVSVSKDKPASNGAVMRTSVVASIYYRDLAQVVEKTVRFAKTTHTDPRCVAASVALTVAMALFFQGYQSVDDVTRHALEIAKEALKNELMEKAPYLAAGETWQQLYQDYAQELETHVKGDFTTLQLDQSPKGYAYKCVGAAFHALRLAKTYAAQNPANPTQPFRRAIEEVIAQGGDADTNAAPAGALVGAFLGSNKIPMSWKQNLNASTKAVLTETNNMIRQMAGCL